MFGRYLFTCVYGVCVVDGFAPNFQNLHTLGQLENDY